MALKFEKKLSSEILRKENSTNREQMKVKLKIFQKADQTKIHNKLFTSLQSLPRPLSVRYARSLPHQPT